MNTTFTLFRGDEMFPLCILSASFLMFKLIQSILVKKENLIKVKSTM